MHVNELAIVVVNYRSARLTIDCMRSLAEEHPSERGWRMVIVENGSADDSQAVLDHAIADNGWSDWARVLRRQENRGFAAGNNIVLRELLETSGTPPRFVLLLNPDTVVRRRAVDELLQFMAVHPRAGIAGSRLEDPDGSPQPSAFNFPSVLGEFELSARIGLITRLLRRWMIAPDFGNEAHRCNWVAGACMLIRREVFEQIGLLDEGFFMYYEEVDFCRRAARAGWECWRVPTARVVHLVGKSSGVTDTRRPPARLPGYCFESRRRYFEKNHGRPYRIAADIAWTLGHALYAIHRPLRGKCNVDPPMVVRDFLSHALRPSTSE